MENENKLLPLQEIEIRKVWHNEQWYFSIVDVVEVLTDTKNSNRYWSDLKRKMEKESGQSYENIVRLNLPRKSGKTYPSDCANTEGVFRVIMSIPSSKAEPLKLWLAEQGKRAIDEAENPELLTERQAELYRAKGYSEEWITKRIQTIDTRKLLTSEWKKRGITESKEYSILTATIAKGTFGLTPTEHAKHKDIGNKNLRDHMTPLELIFSALGEETTRQLTEKENAVGYMQSHEIAVKGGEMVGKSLKGFEETTGLKVVSAENFLHLKKADMPDELPNGVSE